MLNKGNDVTIVATGHLVWEALLAAEQLEAEGIAAEVIKISGASDIFMGGVVTYSDEAKIDILNVTKEEIKKFGVVSENIAFLMAKNSKELFSGI